MLFCWKAACWPGTTNVIPDLLRVAPDMKLIVQAVQADENHTVELYRRGVRGIISRSISPDLLVRCVRRIAAGETWIDNQSVNWVIEAYRSQAAALVSPRTQPRLSPKEMAIITCITQGKRNKEIAFQLGTTEQVIKNYLRKIYDKLGVSDRLELALYCLHNKIIQTDADEEVSGAEGTGKLDSIPESRIEAAARRSRSGPESSRGICRIDVGLAGQFEQADQLGQFRALTDVPAVQPEDGRSPGPSCAANQAQLGNPCPDHAAVMRGRAAGAQTLASSVWRADA